MPRVNRKELDDRVRCLCARLGRPAKYTTGAIFLHGAYGNIQFQEQISEGGGISAISGFLSAHDMSVFIEGFSKGLEYAFKGNEFLSAFGHVLNFLETCGKEDVVDEEFRLLVLRSARIIADRIGYIDFWVRSASSNFPTCPSCGHFLIKELPCPECERRAKEYD